MGWSSYQNTNAWSPLFSPSYRHTSKLDEDLTEFLQASSSHQDQYTSMPQIPTWSKSDTKGYLGRVSTIIFGLRDINGNYSKEY